MKATTEHIKIAIADDHPLVISGLRSILLHYPHLELINDYPDGKALMQGLKNQVPDVLLLDIQLPGRTGDELLPLILDLYPTLRVLALTNFDSPLYASTMFGHGAHGYILKTADNETLTRAIETVYAGKEFVELLMKEKMEQAKYKTQKALTAKIFLTKREAEILQLLVDGLTNVQISKTLALSIKTIDNYRTYIMVKLGVNNTAQLVKKALQMGLAK